MMQLAKSPTGIKGLDEITGGGFPEGRSTLEGAAIAVIEEAQASEVLLNPGPAGHGA
jgi:hypothetical protein